jgi:hypothetical protein
MTDIFKQVTKKYQSLPPGKSRDEFQWSIVVEIRNILKDEIKNDKVKKIT